MKKIFGIVCIISFLTVGTAFAQMDMTNMPAQNAASAQSIQSSPTLSAALSDIYRSQNVVDLSQLSCAKITEAQFEKLGDVIMGLGITEEQHTAMENMMGGENSTMSKSAHINLGRSYLSCLGSNPSGFMAVMGGYYGGNNWFGYVTTILFWILLVLGILSLIKRLKRNK